MASATPDLRLPSQPQGITSLLIHMSHARSMICVSVSLSVGHTSEPCKTAEPIKAPAGGSRLVWAQGTVHPGGPGTPQKGALWGEMCRFFHHHHHHHGRVTGDGRRVVTPPCPRSTARLQRSPVGRVESFRSWSSHLFRGRPGGRRHVRSGGRLSGTLMWS